MLDKSLNFFLISQEYKNLANIFLLLKANILSPHQNKNYAIKLELGKIPFYDKII